MRQLDDVETTCLAIADLVLKRGAHPSGVLPGMCCTTEDKAAWLKGLPKVLAWYLGHAASPPFSTHAAKITTLIADCDAAYAAVRSSVEIEYGAMRRGDPLVLPLILRTRAAIRSAGVGS